MQRKNKRKILTIMFLSMFWCSFGYIMYSALVSTFINKYSLTISEAGLMGSVLCGGQFLAQFVCGPLSKRFTKLQLVFISGCVSALSLLMIATSFTYPILLVAFLMNGLSISLMNVAICAYISDEFPDRRSSYLNIFHGIYGMGSMLGPVLPTVLLAQKMNWQCGYTGVIIIELIILCILFTLRKTPYCGKKTEGSAQPFVALLKNPRLIMLCGCTMLAVGSDTVIGTYMATYFETQLNAVAIGGIAITFFWGGSAVGRFLYPLLFSRFHPKKFVATVNLLTSILLIIGLLMKNTAVMFIVMGFTGMFSGFNYPMEIGFACELFPADSILATNAVCFFASVGGIIAPLITGKLIESGGYSLMIMQVVVMLAGITVILAALVKIEQKK